MSTAMSRSLYTEVRRIRRAADPAVAGRRAKFEAERVLQERESRRASAMRLVHEAADVRQSDFALAEPRG